MLLYGFEYSWFVSAQVCVFVYFEWQHGMSETLHVRIRYAVIGL